MKKSLGFMVIVFLLFLFSNQAYAYLDPGTGSMILQALLAALLAVSVSIGIFWRRLKAFFGRFKKRRDNDEASNES